MSVGGLLAHLAELEEAYDGALRGAAERNRSEHDVLHQCLAFAVTSEQRRASLRTLRSRHQGEPPSWPVDVPSPGENVLEQLRALYVLAQTASVTWAIALQTAKATRDVQFEETAEACRSELEMQARWFLTRIKASAPQALLTRTTPR
jgi:hypothetical protein